jgi:hypothetical protein
MAALLDEGGEFLAQGSDVGELSVNLSQVLPRDGIHGLAGRSR